MARSDKIYPSPSNLHRKHRRQLFKGEVFTPRVDWNAVMSDRSTTASSSEWSTDDDSVVAIASAALTSGVTSVTATAAGTGRAALKNTITFANGSVGVAWWKIAVKDDG
jgi:hypothetical protein